MQCAVAFPKIMNVLNNYEGATMREDATLEDVQKKFANDHFASDVVGVRIVEASKGHAICELDVADRLRNEKGGIMGGAIFTLADFAIVAASAIGQEASVSVSINIEFMSATKGDKLVAEATVDKEGRRLAFYSCFVKDSLDRPIAKVTATVMHVE